MYKQEYDYQYRHSNLLLGKKASSSQISLVSSIYQFVHLNWEKGEEAAVTSNGHSGERRCSSSHTSGKEASLRWWQSFAVGGNGHQECKRSCSVLLPFVILPAAQSQFPVASSTHD